MIEIKTDRRPRYVYIFNKCLRHFSQHFRTHIIDQKNGFHMNSLFVSVRHEHIYILRAISETTKEFKTTHSKVFPSHTKQNLTTLT